MTTQTTPQTADGAASPIKERMCSMTFDPLKTGEKWCKEIDASILLCISIDANGNIVSFSHGRTKQLCKEAGKLLDDIHDNIIEG